MSDDEMSAGGPEGARALIRELDINAGIKGAAGISFWEPLNRHTSLGIGGRAEVYARPADAGALSALLAAALAGDRPLPVFFLGGGTNLLVTDEQIRALVISTAGLRGTEIMPEGGSTSVISVYAGEPLKKVLAFCMEKGLRGLESLAGIPGSLGGAVAGNAGANGIEIKDVIRRVHVMDEKGVTRELTPKQMDFRYRGSAVLDGSGGPAVAHRGGLIVKAELALEEGDPAEIKNLMKRNFEMKKKTQPLQARSAGCVFRNPAGHSAGRLIDEAGLKGARIGDIEVSPLHANFFINRGEGKAGDFLKLMDRVADEVKKRFGLILEPEIRILQKA